MDSIIEFMVGMLQISLLALGITTTLTIVGAIAILTYSVTRKEFDFWDGK